MSVNLDKHIKKVEELFDSEVKNQNNFSLFESTHVFGGLLYLTCIKSGLKYSKQEEGKSDYFR